jgi:hypothetical protein
VALIEDLHRGRAFQTPGPAVYQNVNASSSKTALTRRLFNVDGAW